MIGVLVVSHGDFAAGMLSAATLIMGPMEQVAALGLQAGDAPEAFGEAVTEAGRSLDSGEGLIILADLAGGTPFNQSCLASRGRGWHVISGVSLPMVLQAVSTRSFTDLSALIEETMAAGRDGIRSISERLAHHGN